MIGKKALKGQNLKKRLEQEFLLSTENWSGEDYRRAAAALTAFDSVEAFLENTGWGLDNPECIGEEYLTENRICRWIDGKFVYFSRLLWEGGR